MHFLKKLISMAKRCKNIIFKTDNNAKNIQILKDSIYFDAEYYLSQYPDVAINDADPYIHYFTLGWTEHRNPCENFDNDLYLKLNASLMSKKMNPVIHYEISGKNNPNIIGPGHRLFTGYKTVRHILNERFSECIPFNILPTKNDKKRLNVIFNGFDRGCFFGGKATALILAVYFANKTNCTLRIIAQNPERDILSEFTELFNLEMPKNVEYFAKDFNTLLEVSDNDDFLCTMWENAAAVLATPGITGKIFYIMQEVETYFYDHGDNHLKCFQTLTDERLIPVVNSKLLYDYLCANGYENVKKNGIYFEPVFSKKLLKPNENTFKEKENYKLFFYGRPSHQRNICYFGLECLNDAFLSGALDEKKWEVYLAGDASLPKINFDCDIKVHQLGVMSWKQYCDFVSTVDLCYSMIYTPHPSYPPLDTTTAGAVSVTNRYANKQDLSCYSKNIIMADLNKTSMLEALNKAQALAFDFETRKKNHAESHTAGSWSDTFAPVIEHMCSFLKEDN